MEMLNVNLSQVPFRWIAAAAEYMGVTGVLTLEKGEGLKQFYYRNGSIVFVSSTIEGERFGEFLYSSGCFDRDRMIALVNQARLRGVRFTADLISEGVFDAKELESALEKLVLKVMNDALDWTQGACRFNEGLPDGIVQGPVHIAVENPLLQVAPALA